MEKESTSLTGQASEEQIAIWKYKHGDIFSAVVDNHIAYFKKPSRQQLAYSMTLQNNPLKQTECILRECFVGGSEVILTNSDYFMGSSSIVKTLVSTKTVEVESSKRSGWRHQ